MISGYQESTLFCLEQLNTLFNIVVAQVKMVGYWCMCCI